MFLNNTCILVQAPGGFLLVEKVGGAGGGEENELELDPLCGRGPAGVLSDRSHTVECVQRPAAELEIHWSLLSTLEDVR